MHSSDQQRIGERYDLRECIGIGGMARVYLAHDWLLDRDVAVKILNPALASDPLFVERFRREAHAAATLNHPNIVTIYDTGATDDTHYIVMEYVAGPNLKETVRARGPLPEGEALAIGAHVAAALEVAHTHHLVHRDIKPHNILLGPNGKAKVTDFGIARAAGASQLTATQTVMGTAHYLSPEQALHQPLDGRSDLYSLGIVLYEALTGRLPFDGDSLVAVAMRQVHDPPPPLHQFAPGTSPRTERVIMRALAKDPTERYASAAEMGAALLNARRALQPPVDERAWAPPPIVKTAALLPALSPPFPQGLPGEDRRHSRRWLLLPVIAALCMVVALVGVLALHSLGRGQAVTASPPAATIAAAVVSPIAASLPTATRAARLTPTTPPTIARAIPRTVPAPSPTPLALPTATPPAAPTATAVAGGASSPAQAVQRFYQYAGQHQFDAAARLWTARMRAQFPPEGNINGHFGQDERVEATIGQVTMTANDQATVTVDVIEFRSGGTVRFVGSWQVVRGPSGWLLNQPDLRPA